MACALADKLTQQHDIEWIVERYVEGREFNSSIIETPDGPKILPIAEIEFRDYATGMHKIVDYKAKWESESFESTNTVRRYDHSAGDRRLVDTMTDLSLRIWNGFGLGGWARLDFRVAKDGTPYVVDINANPDLSLDAGFLAAAAQGGLDPSAAVDLITSAAFRAARAR